MKKTIKFILAGIITIVFAALAFYFFLPAINIFNQEFWIFLTVICIVFAISYSLLGRKNKIVKTIPLRKHIGFKDIKNLNKGKIIMGAFIVFPILVLLIGNFLSSTLFNAHKYSNVIEVEDAVFETDMPESSVVSNIALMDSESAQIIGKRTLGSLSDVVSQYQVNGTYYQINYKGTPQKVSVLEYVDFFKWMNNKKSGIPGYVKVDPVNSTAEYVKFSDNIQYAESAYFGKDLHRALRFSFPTKIFGSYSFELDENGNPYYIVSCMSPKVGLFGAMDVSEVIIFNPINGDVELYELADVPSWVDNVFTGTLASQKYDWYGTLKNGFWNSIIGNKECKVTTDDFGYIVIGDDVWFFTGVTSVSNDESNIGFIISNARTGRYKFYNVVGAEEYSAMQAAEGEVQEMGYVASFPSLVNISGEATYIMVLKDSGGIVKRYAFVNVEQYSIVATASTQEEAKQEYLKLLKQEGVIGSDDYADIEEFSSDITVTDIDIIAISGESVIYLKGEDDCLYKQTISADERLVLVDIGDKIKVSYFKTNIDGIRQIKTWSFAD